MVLLSAFLLTACCSRCCRAENLIPVRDEVLLKVIDQLADEAQEGSITAYIDLDAPRAGNTAMNYRDRELLISKGFIEDWQSGKLSDAEVLFVLCHEIGHINPLGHNQKDPNNEIFADYYGLILADEYITDYHLEGTINLDDAIKFFIDYPSNGNRAHPPSAVRYKYLKEKLDYWKAHKDHAPEA